MNLRDTLTIQAWSNTYEKQIENQQTAAQSGVQGEGTSEGAEKGWENRDNCSRTESPRRRTGEDELDEDAPYIADKNSRTGSGSIAKPARGHSDILNGEKVRRRLEKLRRRTLHRY